MSGSRRRVTTCARCASGWRRPPATGCHNYSRTRRQEIVVNRPLPWDESDADTPRPWTDADDVRCAEWLQRREINLAPVVVSRSVGAVARDIRIHPVREYLNRLHWDGTDPRVISVDETRTEGFDDVVKRSASRSSYAERGIADCR